MKPLLRGIEGVTLGVLVSAVLFDLPPRTLFAFWLLGVAWAAPSSMIWTRIGEKGDRS